MRNEHIRKRNNMIPNIKEILSQIKVKEELEKVEETYEEDSYREVDLHPRHPDNI